MDAKRGREGRKEDKMVVVMVVVVVVVVVVVMVMVMVMMVVMVVEASFHPFPHQLVSTHNVDPFRKWVTW